MAFEASIDRRDIRAVLEFRDVYARYTGLAMALTHTNGDVPNELFDISGHKGPDLAARCLARRNRRRLEFHMLQAKNEFDDAVTKLAAADPKITGLARRLTGLLDS